MSDLVLDVNPLDGSVTYFRHDAHAGTSDIWTVSDLSPMIERNKASQNAADHSARTFSDGRFQYHVASLTQADVEALVKSQVITRGFKILDDKKFSAFLNDPDFKYLRKLTAKTI